MISTIKAINPVQDVVASVGVNDVNDYPQLQCVSLIHKILEVVRCSLSGAGRKIPGHVVAEGSVVSVLLDRHYLYSVVA